MTAGFSVKSSHIEDDLILVLKKQKPTVKVITVRLKIYLHVKGNGDHHRLSLSGGPILRTVFACFDQEGNHGSKLGSKSRKEIKEGN